MGVHTYTLAEITTSIAPKRLFQALQIDNHNLAKNLPKFAKSIEFIQGDSTTVGCIKQINMSDDSPFKYMKNRMDEIDPDKYYVKYTTIEGDILGDTLKCIVFENKFEQSEAGCRFTVIGHYHTMGDIKVNEDDIACTKEGIKEKVKAVEDYLLANPQVHA